MAGLLTGAQSTSRAATSGSHIDTDLANDDVPGAAHKLRRYLEAVMADIAESLRAHVPYRPDPSYDLGEFLSAVKGRHSELLKKAAASASSWKNPQAGQLVQDLKDQRAKVIPGLESESWAINKLVHDNDWATMVGSDFAPSWTHLGSFLTCSLAVT